MVKVIAVQAPEMVRVPLEELVLQIHLLKLGPANDFLQQVLEPPPAKSIEGALAQLQSVGALTKDEQLTPLGTHVLLRSCTCLCIKVISSACRPATVASAAKSFNTPSSAGFVCCTRYCSSPAQLLAAASHTHVSKR